MDVGGDVVHVDLLAGRGDIECAVGVLRAAGQPELQTFLIINGLLGALDRYGVGEVDRQVVAVAVGQLRGEGHARVRLRTADLHGVGCEVLGIVIADADHRGVRGLPCDLGPQMQIIGRIVVHAALVHAFLDHVVRDGGEGRVVVQLLRDADAIALCAQRFERLALVQTEGDGHVFRLVVVRTAGEGQRRPAVQSGRGSRAVVVPLIMQRAVRIDAGMRVREHILRGDRGLHRNGNALDAASGQAGLRHIQKIFIRSVFGLIILLQKRLCSVQLFAGGLFLVGHIFAPAGVEVEEFSVLAALIAPVPVAVIPFAKQLRAVGVYRLAAGTGGPARERVAFAAQRAGRQVNGLVKRGALVFHAACHVSAVGVVADHVAEAVPLRLERHAAVTVGAEVIGGRHAVAQRAVRQHDVPVVIPLSAGEFGAVQRGKHRMAVFVNVGVQNGFLIAIAVKMNGQIGLLGLPERVERGVRRQLDCRAVVIDLFACGQKRPAREAEARFRKGVGRQRALAPGQRLRVHRALAAVRVEGDGDIAGNRVGAADVLQRHCAGRHEIFFRVEIDLENVACFYIHVVRTCEFIAAGALGDCIPVKTQLGVAVGRTVTDGEQMLEPEVAVFLERKRQNRVRVLIQLAAVLVEDGHTGSVVAGVPCRGLIRCRKRRCGHGEIVAEVVGPGRFRRVILCKDRCVGVKGVACCEDLCGQKAQKHDQHKHDG